MKGRPSHRSGKAPKAPPKPRPDALIDPKVLHDLIEVFQAAGVSDLEVERSGLRVRLRRQETSAPSQSQDVTIPGADQTRGAHPVEVKPSAKSDEGLVTVTSPIVGIFFRSASPEAEAYVEVGSYVRKGQVLCIVEAMKLMNEIESEYDGRVAEILMENAKPVEFGEPLFLIEPGTRPEG
jgi:acetyl-CoA carboxylase biotin carboxyl carrier protein